MIEWMIRLVVLSNVENEVKNGEGLQVDVCEMISDGVVGWFEVRRLCCV